VVLDLNLVFVVPQRDPLTRTVGQTARAATDPFVVPLPERWRPTRHDRICLEQACWWSVLVKPREVGEGRKHVIWVACPGRSIVEPGVGAVLTQF
jgi:hypothetical protein